jgi:hypothetical protein
MTPENQGRHLRTLVASVHVKAEKCVVEVKLGHFAVDTGVKKTARSASGSRA